MSAKQTKINHLAVFNSNEVRKENDEDTSDPNFSSRAMHHAKTQVNSSLAIGKCRFFSISFQARERSNVHIHSSNICHWNSHFLVFGIWFQIKEVPDSLLLSTELLTLTKDSVSKSILISLMVSKMGFRFSNKSHKLRETLSVLKSSSNSMWNWYLDIF